MISASSFATPIGFINIVAEDETIIELTMSTQQGPRMGSAKVLKTAEKQIQQYFKGKRQSFDLDFRLDGTEFQKSVWKQIAEIPFGKTKTYQQIASAIGKPLASRAVGGAVGANPVGLILGCHRVLGANDRITGYSGGEGVPTKRLLLALEGIETKD